MNEEIPSLVPVHVRCGTTVRFRVSVETKLEFRATYTINQSKKLLCFVRLLQVVRTVVSKVCSMHDFRPRVSYCSAKKCLVKRTL